jgi:hypothetical protein
MCRGEAVSEFGMAWLPRPGRGRRPVRLIVYLQAAQQIWGPVNDPNSRFERPNF